MSDKLIVEFYRHEDVTEPVARILACHGGDNPSSAATTLADFFDQLSSLRESRFNDAGLLAARFIVWESSKGTVSSNFDFTDVALLPLVNEQNYQTVRAREDRPYVHCVKDEWTSHEELVEAAMILRQSNVGPLELALKI